jgi:hypothetical protein
MALLHLSITEENAYVDITLIRYFSLVTCFYESLIQKLLLNVMPPLWRDGTSASLEISEDQLRQKVLASLCDSPG